MQLAHDRFPGLMLLVRLNADWLITVATVALALLAGCYFGLATISF